MVGLDISNSSQPLTERSNKKHVHQLVVRENIQLVVRENIQLVVRENIQLVVRENIKRVT